MQTFQSQNLDVIFGDGVSLIKSAFVFLWKKPLSGLDSTAGAEETTGPQPDIMKA